MSSIDGVGQRLIAVDAGESCLDIFSPYLICFLSHYHWETDKGWNTVSNSR